MHSRTWDIRSSAGASNRARPSDIRTLPVLATKREQPKPTREPRAFLAQCRRGRRVAGCAMPRNLLAQRSECRSVSVVHFEHRKASQASTQGVEGGVAFAAG
jgi:hypothetical protein